MTTDLPELVREAVQSLTVPVADADAVAQAVTSRAGVAHLDPPTSRDRGRLVFTAAAAFIVVVVAAVTVATRTPQTPVTTTDTSSANARYVPTYIPKGWKLSSVDYQELRDDPALRSTRAFGAIDSFGYVTEGLVVQSYRPAVTLPRNRDTRSVTAGGRVLDIDDPTNSIVFTDAGYQIFVQHVGMRTEEAISAAKALVVGDDGVVTYPDHRPSFDASPPDLWTRGARWFDITLVPSGTANPTTSITVGVRTGLQTTMPMAVDRAGTATTIHGRPALESKVPGSSSLFWKPDAGASLSVQGPVSPGDVRQIAEGIVQSTAVQWEDFVATAANHMPDIVSGRESAVALHERSTARGGDWIELAVPVDGEMVRISPEGGGLGTPVVRIGRHTVVGFFLNGSFVNGQPTGASVDGVSAADITAIPVRGHRIAVVAIFDEVLDPTTVTVTVDGHEIPVTIFGHAPAG